MVHEGGASTSFYHENFQYSQRISERSLPFTQYDATSSVMSDQQGGEESESVMKTDASDPWRGTRAETAVDDGSPNDRFEDSFLDEDRPSHRRLSDSEQYLQKLYSRLKVLQGGTTKKDLVKSLSVAKEDCVARLITSGNNPRSEEEADLASNPLIRHIAPHLQALTAGELVHLLKADVLQATTQAEQEQDSTEELQTNQPSTEHKPEPNN